MRAVVTDGRGGLHAAELSPPVPPVAGALVRVLACGLCGSDLEKLSGPGAMSGQVLGHEVVGMLERPGEEPVRVALAHHVPCGSCAACRSGHSSLCPQFTSTKLDPGGFAERLAVSHLHLQDAVLPLPDRVDDLTGTLLEPLSCALRAFDVVRGLQAAFPLSGLGGRFPAPRWEGPARVLVAGCGSMGLLLLSVLARDALHPGGPGAAPPAGEVFFLERDPTRAALATRLGARPLAEAESAEHAARGTATLGADAALVAATPGMDIAIVTAPAALAETIGSMAAGGIVVIFASRGATSDLNLDLVYRRELSLAGVRSGSPAHLRRALALLAEGHLPVDWFQPEVVGLEDLPAAAHRYERGEALKVVARP